MNKIHKKDQVIQKLADADIVATEIVVNDLSQLTGIKDFSMEKCSYRRLLELAITRWPDLAKELESTSSVYELRTKLVDTVKRYYLEENSKLALVHLILAKGWEFSSHLSSESLDLLLRIQSELEEGCKSTFFETFAISAKPLISELIRLYPAWPAGLLPRPSETPEFLLPKNWADMASPKPGKLILVFWLPSGSRLGGKPLSGLIPARRLGVSAPRKYAQSGQIYGQIRVRIPDILETEGEIYPVDSEVLVEVGWR